MKTKQKKIYLIIGIVLLIVPIALAISRFYVREAMKKIPEMSSKDCLNYTLDGEDDAVITIGTIQNDTASWNVYGRGGKELPRELYDYEIGSISKTITASMIMELVQADKINLDDSIDKYLELPNTNQYPTLKELLIHSSRYQEHYFESPMISNFFSGKNSFHSISDDMLLNRIAKVDTENGDKSWQYSNFGFAVLGQVLEEVNHKEYTDQANEFLKVHGMKSSYVSNGHGNLDNYWDWEPGDAYMPAGAIISNIEDMLIYARQQIDGTGVFSKMHDEVLEINVTSPEYERMNIHIDAMGMAWIIDKKNGFIWHNGATGNYNSYLGFCPHSQTAVVVLSNLPAKYKIPATVIGVKTLMEMQ